MAINAQSKGNAGGPPQIPAGTHHGITYGVIDIGTQPPPPGSSFPARRKVVFMWELPRVRADFEDEQTKKKVNKPRAISKTFTLSLAKNSKLKPFLEGWRGRGFTAEELKAFDVSKLMGVNCLLTVVHENGKGDNAGNVYANVSAASKLMDGMNVQKPENTPLTFSFDDIKGSEIVFPKNMPEWVQKRIMQSDEFIHLQQQHGVPGAGSELSQREQERREANQNPTGAPDEESVPF